MSCPDDNEMLALVEGTLPGPRAASVRAHVDDCATCQEIAAVMLERTKTDRGAKVDAGARSTSPLALSGRTIGRYRLRRTVGAGAMGVVYLADDPSLDRTVAVKLLRHRDDDAEQRLLREARALARLAHPNVIVVHEVGTDDDLFFMAMEYVEGSSLRAWLSAAPRSVEAILDVFAQAGRGLAVAHAAGLIHRDFKPDNVLVGVDGRVRVVDFGLARTSKGFDAPAATAPAPAILASGPVTQTGTVIGTPAYMAPEQQMGEPASIQSDQFAFAVALYEALHGQRPFRAPSFGALLEAKRSQNVVWPRSAREPAHVRSAIRRGLSAFPEQRFPSMDEFVTTLEHAPGSARRRVGVTASVVLACATLAVAWASARSGPQAAGPTASSTSIHSSGSAATSPEVHELPPKADPPAPMVATSNVAHAPSRRAFPPTATVRKVAPPPSAAPPSSSSDLFDTLR